MTNSLHQRAVLEPGRPDLLFGRHLPGRVLGLRLRYRDGHASPASGVFGVVQGRPGRRRRLDGRRRGLRVERAADLRRPRPLRARRRVERRIGMPVRNITSVHVRRRQARRAVRHVDGAGEAPGRARPASPRRRSRSSSPGSLFRVTGLGIRGFPSRGSPAEPAPSAGRAVGEERLGGELVLLQLPGGRERQLVLGHEADQARHLVGRERPAAERAGRPPPTTSRPACGRSPRRGTSSRCGSGTPVTNAACTPGWLISTSSTSTGATLIPPVLTISLMRPRKCRVVGVGNAEIAGA